MVMKQRNRGKSWRINISIKGSFEIYEYSGFFSHHSSWTLSDWCLLLFWKNFESTHVSGKLDLVWWFCPRYWYPFPKTCGQLKLVTFVPIMDRGGHFESVNWEYPCTRTFWDFFVQKMHRKIWHIFCTENCTEKSGTFFLAVHFFPPSPSLPAFGRTVLHAL